MEASVREGILFQPFSKAPKATAPYKLPTNFSTVPIAPHLEWRLNGEWAVVRRRTDVPQPRASSADDRYTTATPGRAFEMHPNHPLLPRLGFPRGFPGAMIYCPGMATAFWATHLFDAWRMLREMEDLLDQERPGPQLIYDTLH